MMDQDRNPEVDPVQDLASMIEHRKNEPEVEEGDRNEGEMSAWADLEPHWSQWRNSHRKHIQGLDEENKALLERRKKLNKRCLFLIIGILGNLCVMAAYFEVAGPFFAVQQFVETTCHVISVREDDRGTDCRRVYVDYDRRESGDDVTTILHLNENHLYYDKCYPAYPDPTATLCFVSSQLDPPGPCSIPCLYDPQDNSRVIKDLTYKPSDVIISVTSTVALAFLIISFILVAWEKMCLPELNTNFIPPNESIEKKEKSY